MQSRNEPAPLSLTVVTLQTAAWAVESAVKKKASVITICMNRALK
jgi:hypothetical protein